MKAAPERIALAVFTLLVFLFCFTSAFGQSRPQGWGELVVYGFPRNAKITLISRSGDEIQPTVDVRDGYTVFSWVWSSDCVDFWPSQFGPFQYELFSRGNLLHSGHLGFATSTCLEPNETEEERERCEDVLYPNPTSGKVYSECGGKFLLFDAAGRFIREVRGVQFDLSSHPDGVYYFWKWNHKTRIIKKRF